jgi:phosphoribosylaminoimidazole carboxylase
LTTDIVLGEELMAPLINLVNNMRAERMGLPATQPSIISSISVPQSGQPLVAVTMGSDSDLPVLKPGLALLKTFGIPYFLTITSAHRTPHRMIAFAESAAEKGIKVIIAAAGGAAHLPGMLASDTPLPVIGVPVKGSTLDGMDSLLSIVQMPRGVPVATVSINNSVSQSSRPKTTR